MANVTVKIPESLLKKTKKAIEGSSVTLEQALVMGLQDLIAQPHFLNDDHLNSLLEEGLHSPALVADAAYWRKKLTQLKKKSADRGKRKSA